VNTKTTVNAGAGQADENAEFGRGPLRVRGAAVAANVVFGFFLDHRELCSLHRQPVNKKSQWTMTKEAKQPLLAPQCADAER